MFPFCAGRAHFPDLVLAPLDGLHIFVSIFLINLKWLKQSSQNPAASTLPTSSLESMARRLEHYPPGRDTHLCDCHSQWPQNRQMIVIVPSVVKEAGKGEGEGHQKLT